MSINQSKRLQLNLPTVEVSKFLKFCYFIIALALFACGEDTSKSTKQNKQSTAEIEETKVSTAASKIILCFGDSITAGYGLDDTNDAYPAILQQKIDSLALNYTVINSGVSGETTAGGKSRIDWVIKQDVSVFLLELGANDGLRGVPISETRANLQAIIDIVQTKSPETTIILAGMELPPNLGQVYTKEFRQMYPDLAKKNNLKLIPFILKDVGGIAALNQSDGIHPTAEGHKIVANTVWELLKTTIIL
ncbi:arylesterase [Aquimarina addita]|uniref:Arylesterase n=1 Tax=Aquimarina addita TaxID=870485 RepID=A0ABP6UPR7_9FLAO